ncbi:MAG: hypothetical protein NTW50_03810, partial [Candidatus Berkelbacteria bacterium]|nr:hypothetical protein [Candidatus Berkelbacteria bacterium]
MYPEILIIVSLAGALFLLLRHYPEAKSDKHFFDMDKIKEVVGKMMSRSKKPKTVEAIKEAIEKDQEKIVPPVVIERAIADYDESDHD